MKDQVAADWKASQTWGEIVTTATHMGELGDEKKLTKDSCYEIISG